MIISDIESYRKLSLVDRLIVREAVEYMAFRLKNDIIDSKETLANHLKDLGLIDNNHSIPTTEGVLEEYFDVNSASFMLKSPIVSSYLKEWGRVKLNKHISTTKDVQDASSRTLLGQTRPMPSSISFVSKESDEFTDWLPIIGYQELGKVYKITEDFKLAMNNSFPSVDVDLQLSRMFKWFMEDESRLRRSKQINTFVKNWLSRSFDSNEDKVSNMFNEIFND